MKTAALSFANRLSTRLLTLVVLFTHACILHFLTQVCNPYFAVSKQLYLVWVEGLHSDVRGHAPA